MFNSFNQSYLLWSTDIEMQQGAPIFAFNQKQVRQSNIAMQSIADVANIRFIQASQDSTDLSASGLDKNKTRLVNNFIISQPLLA